MCGGKILETIHITTLVLFSFCTCCILRCLVCIVVSCVYCCLLMYICCTMCVCVAVFTLDAGLLARSQYPEGPATGHRFFSVSLCL